MALGRSPLILLRGRVKKLSHGADDAQSQMGSKKTGADGLAR
jgi:hypothetical protein